jgi:putative FmdB family regulatory protein
MPIYEYRCSACGHELESLQKLRDAPLVTCPACGAETLVKKVSAAGFQLKGSGWYATDFRNAGKPAAKPDTPAAGAASGDAKPAEAKADAKPETKSDAKPDAKADTKPASTPAPAPASSSAGSKTD